MEPEYVVTNVSLKLNENDRFLIFSDEENKKFGKAIEREGKKVCETAYIELEEFSKRPIKEYPEKLRNFVEEFKPTATVYLAKSKPGEVKFRISLIKHLLKLNVRHVHMPGLDERIWNTGLRADYNKVREVTMKVFEVVKDSKEIEVRNTDGTEIFVKGFYRWVPDTGIFDKQGKWGNLPAGEVFTTPKKIEGRFFARVLGDYFIRYGVLKDPVIFEIENSRVVDIKHKKDDLRKELERYILNGPDNSERVGEFAIGTNIFLKEIIGNLLQDEKFPGVHIAFGDPIGEETGAPWECDVHLDVISLNTDVIVDGMKIMERGRFI